ncbi:MAG: GGDEF domain-containing protein, partial [Ilumatobacteraceae bacterium]
MTTIDTDESRDLDAYVRERALNTVVINLAPAPFLMVPFVLLVGTVLRNETSPVRIGWWTIAAVIATAINLTALGAYKKHRENSPDLPTGRPITLLLAAGVMALGTFLGMSPWAAADGPLELVLLFLLFPATASAVGCIVTAGRRDFYLAYLVPLVILSAASLYTADDQRLRPLSLMAAFFGAGLMLLHHVVSRGSIEAYRLQWQSDQLLAQLDEERAELTSLNEQLAGTNTRLAHQATHDPLTGLYNRRGTLDLLDQMLAEADADHPLGVLFCDLDHFKAVNDALGHRGGDRFISIIADRLQRSIEPTSVAGRMGGDEFVVVMPGMDITDATNVG